MSRPRSLLLRVEVDVAQRAHNCQSNANHRIRRGDTRLKVRKGRSWDHYCTACATKMISNGQRALSKLDLAFGQGNE